MRCETCGNDYDRAFKVTDHDGQEHHFDSIECAAQVIAPECAHCGCRILGHGVDRGPSVYCCEHCAQSVRTGEPS